MITKKYVVQKKSINELELKYLKMYSDALNNLEKIPTKKLMELLDWLQYNKEDKFYELYTQIILSDRIFKDKELVMFFYEYMYDAPDSVFGNSIKQQIRTRDSILESVYSRIPDNPFVLLSVINKHSFEYGKVYNKSKLSLIEDLGDSLIQNAFINNLKGKQPEYKLIKYRSIYNIYIRLFLFCSALGFKL